MIQADDAYKFGQVFAQRGDWPTAIALYGQAHSLAPHEDFYYLDSGEAYLQYAGSLPTDASRQQVLELADLEMRKGQEMSPLNPDHTANLARLHALWVRLSADPAIRQQHAEIADQYFSTALNLSPQNSSLWNQWSKFCWETLADPERAYDLLQRSLQANPYNGETYALVGDYDTHYLAVQSAGQPEKKRAALASAAQHYQQALDKRTALLSIQWLYDTAVALGEVQEQLGEPDQAIQAYQKALETLPEAAENWQVMLSITRLYAQQQDFANALDYARKALPATPEGQQQPILDLIAQLDG